MNIYDFVVRDGDSTDVSMEKYKGKVLLIVNAATHCGKTKQYTKIEELYKKYKGQGFEVLDFPSNQFLNQAPGTNKEIREFCQLNYGTTFSIFSKIDVNGKKADPLFVHLKNEFKKDINDLEQEANKEAYRTGRGNGRIMWNFTKFLIDRNGNVVVRYGPNFLPEDMEYQIKKLLAQ